MKIRTFKKMLPLDKMHIYSKWRSGMYCRQEILSEYNITVKQLECVIKEMQDKIKGVE